MSGASAANGRDAIAAAPSLPAAADGHLAGAPATVSTEQAAAALARLCGVLAGRLNMAVELSADVGDRTVCAQAAHHAAAIVSLLGGAREEP
jgi:hypothetical protein